MGSNCWMLPSLALPTRSVVAAWPRLPKPTATRAASVKAALRMPVMESLRGDAIAGGRRPLGLRLHRTSLEIGREAGPVVVIPDDNPGRDGAAMPEMSNCLVLVAKS